MNENAQKWVEALESGEYKQGRGALLKGYEFCCLGVACDVAIKNGVALKVDRRGRWTVFDGCHLALPPAVQDWLGLRTEDGEAKDGTCLTSLNDWEDLSFSEIAAVIRSEPPGLFREDA